MGTHTQQQMIQAVLDNLGVLAAGQVPSAEESNTVSDRIAPVIATLIAKGVGLSSDTANLDAIPDEIFLPLAAIIAFECATPFAVTDGKKDRLQKDRDRAYADLTLIYRQGFPRKTLRVDHFWSRRIVRGVGFNFTSGE